MNTPDTCHHELHTLSTRFNGGNPVYTCDGCDTIVGRVKRPTHDEEPDPWPGEDYDGPSIIRAQTGH